MCTVNFCKCLATKNTQKEAGISQYFIIINFKQEYPSILGTFRIPQQISSLLNRAQYPIFRAPTLRCRGLQPKHRHSSFIMWVPISLQSFSQDGQMTKPFLHLDLLPDIWVRSGTGFVLTCPTFFSRALFGLHRPRNQVF